MLYEIEGLKPQIHPTVYLAPGVHIIGGVTVGEYSSIWFNSTLRGDLSPIRIGRHVNIQDNCVIHVDLNIATEIDDYALIGHNAVVHGSRVGPGSLIGMGAILLDGSVVGAGSIIGAGSLVKQNQEIPPGVLALGSPARVIRKLRREELEWTRGAVQNYSRRAQDYKNNLKAL